MTPAGPLQLGRGVADPSEVGCAQPAVGALTPRARPASEAPAWEAGNSGLRFSPFLDSSAS